MTDSPILCIDICCTHVVMRDTQATVTISTSPY